MKKFPNPTGGTGADLRPALGERRRVPPYPVEKLERERAEFDLADAAQAAARATILMEGGAAHESRQLTRLSQRLYDQADAHRRKANQAQRADTGPLALRAGTG